jgi:hypothetical protein
VVMGGGKMVEAVSRHLAPSPPIYFTSMHERKVIFCNELRRRFVVVWKTGGRGSRYPTLSAKSAERMGHPQLRDGQDSENLGCATRQVYHFRKPLAE